MFFGHPVYVYVYMRVSRDTLQLYVYMNVCEDECIYIVDMNNWGMIKLFINYAEIHKE